MKALLRSFVLIASCALAPLLSAQIVFTVTATANNSVQGYTSGQSYTFSFTTNPIVGAAQVKSGTIMAWYDEISSDPQLWSSLGGTGLAGTYVRPTSTSGAPWSHAQVGADNASTPVDYLYLCAGTDDASSPAIGATTLSGSPLRLIEIWIAEGSLPAFSYSGSDTRSLASYFSAYAGSFSGFDTRTLTFNTSTPAASKVTLYYPNTSTAYLTFDVTGLSIAAVPEPSTYAAALAAVALCVTAIRRRKAQSPDNRNSA